MPSAKHTTGRSTKSNNQLSVCANKESNFSLSRRITDNLSYEVITSNKNINEFEKLSYQIVTIKDQYQTISVQIAPDSLKLKSTNDDWSSCR